MLPTEKAAASGPVAMPAPQARPRVEWIDRAKGLGIVLVVIGHVTTEPWLRHAIFLFHMPLFFALSGIWAKPTPIGSFVQKRGEGLVVPFIAFFLLIGLADILLSPLSGRIPYFAGKGWSDILRQVVLVDLGQIYGVFWFVPCLIAISFAFNLLLSYVRRPWLIGLLVVGIALAGMSVPGHRNPVGLGAAPVALLFFWLGWVLKQGRVQLATILLVSIAALILARGQVGLFDMKYREYGLFPGNIAIACLGMIAAMGIARYILVGPIGRWSLWLGQASLTIMFVHQLIHYHLEGHAPEWLIILMAVLIPAVLHGLFGRSKITRCLLNGQGWEKAPRVVPAVAPA